jgi:peptidoglycan/xylan/chitin deacetylase (PgdA/CDA1 family)
MKAVMYHYVREYDKNHPNFRFLDIANFCKQLDFFDKTYGFLDREEWRLFTQFGRLPQKSGKIILTFDDAMRCHYDFVFPELRRRGLWGVFYVPTLSYANGYLLDVHRIHLLCGAFDGWLLLQSALSLVTEDMVPDEKRKEFRDATYKNQANQEGVSEFKRLLNYYVSYAHRTPLIDEIAKAFSYDFHANEFYVKKRALLEMQRDGMIIGSHTVRHPVMSRLSKRDQLHEIRDSFQCLKDIGVTGEKTYCHPYGGFHSFNPDTISILQNEEVRYSFNVEAREITLRDYSKSLHSLPRFDCNYFKHGEAS